MPVTQMGGVQQNVAQYLMLMPYFQRTDFENAIARMEAVPALVDQTIALLEKGVETGITPPRVTLRDVPEQVRNQIVDEAAASPMLRPFQSMPPTIEPPVAETLRAAAARAYTAAVAPAYRRLLEYLETRYLPRTRETIAARDLPDGEAWYAFSIRQMTTTRLSAQEIHDIGLAEVKRIRAEMDAVMARTDFDGTFQQFVGFLRTDERFFFDRAEDLLVAYRDICKRVDPELPKLFATLPRLPYGVVPVPSYAEKSQTTAYYEPGSPSAGRPGRFFANTYDLRARPRWEMEALALHEAVPGHHLQIAWPRSCRRCRSSAARLLHRVHRGLGPLRGEPGRGDGLLPGSLRAVRPAHLRDLARHPPGGGHRHARPGLEPRAGHRLLQRERGQGRARHRGGGGPLHRLAGQALAYKIGELEDQGAARARVGRARRALRPAASTTRCWARAPCPSTCWPHAWTPGWPVNRSAARRGQHSGLRAERVRDPPVPVQVSRSNVPPGPMR
jgi:hypothetical protein